MSDKSRISDKSLNRVLMEIVGPILIMLMVGALVFFLIEIFYRGPHALRLGWVLGLFTAASVLVSRISIADGLERASIFGFALAAATLYVSVTLVDFEYGALFFLEPVVIVLLISVVMWTTNRLTWDCTVIDASRDVSSIGIAELAKRKLFKRNSIRRRSDSAETQAEGEQRGDSKLSQWLFMFFASSKTQNTPGLWVFYFSMAAFPIFGFGQWFAQPSSTWGYRWIFMLFAIYLGSALGLLMLTSLLGLERYLRKRGATMPSSVSINWMVVGTVFALGVMLIMLLLPSPSLSNGLQDALGFLTTNNKDTSEHAIGDDGQADGDNPKKEKQDQDADGAKEKPGDQGAGQGDKGKGGDKKSDAKGDDASGDQKSKSQSESDKESKSKQNEKGDKSSKTEQNKSQDKSEKNRQDDQSPPDNDKKDQPDDKNKNNQNRENDPEKEDENKKENQQNAKQADNQDDRNENANQKRGGKQNPKPPEPSNSRPPSKIAQFLGTIVKYIVYIVGVVALLVLLWMFRDELAKLWAEFFGKKSDENKTGETNTKPKLRVKPLPNFSQFSDPFESGVATKWPAGHTIQHSFQALEAWAVGHNCQRQHDETPIEFAKRLQIIDEHVGAAALVLADLIGESLYSGGAVERSKVQKLQTLWRSMNANRPPIASATQESQMQLANNL